MTPHKAVPWYSFFLHTPQSLFQSRPLSGYSEYFAKILHELHEVHSPNNLQASQTTNEIQTQKNFAKFAQHFPQICNIKFMFGQTTFGEISQNHIWQSFAKPFLRSFAKTIFTKPHMAKFCQTYFHQTSFGKVSSSLISRSFAKPHLPNFCLKCQT